MNDRIVYSDKEMLLSLEAALDSLNALSYDSKYAAQLGEGFVEKLNRWKRDISARKDDPFTLVVVGEFKRGKSTFINALLGEEVATTDVTPETVTLNRIRYGAHRNMAKLPGNRMIRLEDGELRREALRGVLQKLDEPVTQLELERPCELLKRISIIDTPGINDAEHDFSDVAKQSLLQADAVVYVYNVQYPLSQSEQIFLKSVVLPQKYTKLFLVGNYADMLESPEDCENMRAELQKRVEGLLPDAEIIMVSALDELCRKLGKARRGEALRGFLEGQFDHLRAELDAQVDARADSVVVDRMQRLSSAMIADLEAELNAIEAGLRMTEGEALQATERIRQEREAGVERQTQMRARITAAVEEMKLEAREWMLDFTQRIVAESKNLQNVDLDTLFKYFQCYCVDMLQRAMDACLDIHEERLYGLLDDISGELGERLALDGQRGGFSFRISVDNRIWTKGDTMGLVVSRVGFGGLLGMAASLVAQGIAGAKRSSEKQLRTAEVIDEISRQMSGLTISVNQTVDKLYDELAAKADRLASEYCEEELAKAERLGKQTMLAARKQAEEKQRLQETVDTVRAMLGAVRDACN